MQNESSARVRRILVAEDQDGMRKLVHLLIDEEDDLEVVGETGNGGEALTLAASLRPDAIVLDLGLPVVDGEAMLPRLRADLPDARIVVLSGQASAIIQPRILSAGADALVEKGVGDWQSALIAQLRVSA